MSGKFGCSAPTTVNEYASRTPGAAMAGPEEGPTFFMLNNFSGAPADGHAQPPNLVWMASDTNESPRVLKDVPLPTEQPESQNKAYRGVATARQYRSICANACGMLAAWRESTRTAIGKQSPAFSPSRWR